MVVPRSEAQAPNFTGRYAGRRRQGAIRRRAGHFGRRTGAHRPPAVDGRRSSGDGSRVRDGVQHPRLVTRRELDAAVVASGRVAVDERRAARLADEGGHREPRRRPRTVAPGASPPGRVSAQERARSAPTRAPRRRRDRSRPARRARIRRGPRRRPRRRSRRASPAAGLRASRAGEATRTCGAARPRRPPRLHPLPEHVRAPVFEDFAGDAGVAPPQRFEADVARDPSAATRRAA